MEKSYKYLPYKNKKQDFRGNNKRKNSQKVYFPSIHKVSTETLKTDNVWEIDTMHDKTHKKSILVAVERKSKYTLATIVSNLKKQTITKALRDMFSDIDDIKLLIADRGSENRDIKNIQRVLNTRVVFYDPGAPYQKGLVENTNRIFRRFLPKRTSFKNLEQKLLDEITEYINSMKRKSLNYKSAEQVFKTKSCSTLNLTSHLLRRSSNSYKRTPNCYLIFSMRYMVKE